MRHNRIHNTNRSPVSNHITTFLDRHQSKFNGMTLCSAKSKSLNYYYDYFYKNYLKLDKFSKNLKSETDIKNESHIDLYLDNLDSCEFHYQRDQYKSKFTTILKILHQKYSKILYDILNIYEFTDFEKKDILEFIENLQNKKLTEEEVVEWINFKGSKLARTIYIFMLEGKLPQELVLFFGSTPEIYGQFTSLDIQKDIELNLPHGRNYVYQLGDINLSLKIYTYNSNFKIKNSLLDRIFFLNFLTGESNIDLTLWLSDKKKLLDFSRIDRYIGPKEINSGCTTHMGKAKVSIWRKEEMDKVILHELFHSLDLEQRHQLTELEEYIYGHFDIKKSENKLTVFESYVEVFADIINIFLLVQDTYRYSMKKSKTLRGFKGGSLKKRRKSKKSNNLKQEKLEMFWDIIWMESCWILFQAAKILHYFRFQNFSEFFFPKKISEEQKTSKFLQRSNVFSYIILRSAIFFNLNEFLRICRKYNSDRSPMEHNIPNKVIIAFWHNTFKNKKYQKIINTMIQELEKISVKKNVREIIYTSMRMTCVEHK